MKKVLWFLLLALGLASAGFCAEPVLLIDGEWHQDANFGPGGKTWDIVQAQMALYADAKEEAEGILKGETDGDLRAARRACERFALYSFVKCQYAAALGAQAYAAKDYIQADADYRRCLALAVIARTVDTHEDDKNEKSASVGRIYEKLALRHLKAVAKKLGQPSLSK